MRPKEHFLGMAAPCMRTLSPTAASLQSFSPSSAHALQFPHVVLSLSLAPSYTHHLFSFFHRTYYKMYSLTMTRVLILLAEPLDDVTPSCKVRLRAFPHRSTG